MKSILQQSHLYLTQEFARLNGLINRKKVILKNAVDERLWTVDLKKYRNSCYLIGRGWKDFCVSNGLKKGDCFKLEVIDKGEKPIVNFYLQKKKKKKNELSNFHSHKLRRFEIGFHPMIHGRLSDGRTKLSSNISLDKFPPSRNPTSFATISALSCTCEASCGFVQSLLTN